MGIGEIGRSRDDQVQKATTLMINVKSYQIKKKKNKKKKKKILKKFCNFKKKKKKKKKKKWY